MIKKDVIFIWIPKTAGTSVFHVFKKEGCQKLKYLFEFANFKNQGFVTFNHVNIYKLIRNNIVSKDFFNNAFKFTFVRNPWERVVSLYFYRRLFHKYTRHLQSFSEFCKDLEKRFFKRNKILKFYSINEKLKLILIKFCRLRFMFKFLERNKSLIYLIYKFFRNRLRIWRFSWGKIPQVGLHNSKGLSQANPQTNWLIDENGKIPIDFIGKFENLESDFQKLTKILGINAELPHLTRTDHKNYRYYYNEMTKKIVEKIYSKDISIFDYKF